MDPHMPDGFEKEMRTTSTSHGNTVHNDGIGRTGLIVLATLVGLSLGISLFNQYTSARDYRELERENRLLQLKVDEFRAALLARGIDPSPHLKGEAP